MNIPLYAPAQYIFDALKPHKSWIVGGAVRDYLKQNKWVEDIDIATESTPEETMSSLKKAGVYVVATGLKYGTVTAVYKGKSFEITTLRKDLKTNGRHARVVFTKDLKEDAQRRDFTFNALYLDEKGEITDFFNGIEDLKKGIIKFVGDPEQRIQEDFLRILRYFRFFAHYGEGTDHSISMDVFSRQAKGLACLSKERITDEFMKLSKKDISLTHVIEKMEASGVLSACHLCFNGKDDAVKETGLNRLLCLFLTKNSEIIEAFRFSNKQKKFIKNVRQALSSTEPLLVRVYKYTQEATRLAALINGEKEWLMVEPPCFPLSGKDLQERGFKEGEKIGLTLKKIEKWWMENGFPTKKECLEYLEKEKSEHMIYK